MVHSFPLSKLQFRLQKNAAQHPGIICRLCRRFFMKAAFAASYDSFLLNNRYFRAKKFQRNAIIVETIFPII